MRQLEFRREELLAKSQINRQTLALEWQQIKVSLAWARSGIELAKSLRPLWVLLAPLAGIAAARQWRSVKGLWHKGRLLWLIAGRLRALWQYLH
jgi:hypothetical protein